MPGLHTAQSNRGLATPTVPRDRDLRSEDQSSCVSFPLACADAVQHIPPAKCRVFPCVEDLRRAAPPQMLAKMRSNRNIEEQSSSCFTLRFWAQLRARFPRPVVFEASCV